MRQERVEPHVDNFDGAWDGGSWKPGVLLVLPIAGWESGPSILVGGVYSI